jgi:hypothetical protein
MPEASSEKIILAAAEVLHSVASLFLPGGVWDGMILFRNPAPNGFLFSSAAGKGWLMLRTFSFGSALVCWALASAPATAHHFAIDLEVKAPKGNQTAHAQIAALGEKPKPRAALEVKAGDKITVKWTLRSTAAKETAKDVLVHFYAVKINKLGEPPPSKLDEDVVTETALTMDFKPKDKTEGELRLQIDKPGFYLLRLETIGAAVGLEGHEHFAALDLIVQ